MTTPAQEYLDQVKDIVLGHLRGHQVTVYLFGSHARGTPRRASDIDVAIESPRPLPPIVLAELRDLLEESTVPYRVDIVDLNAVDSEFRKAVKREAIRWSG